MTQIKLTKNELRDQERKRDQLMRYLPTLQLKKALLQTEVGIAQSHIEKLETEKRQIHEEIERFQSLLGDLSSYELLDCLKIGEIKKVSENIAGVEVFQLDEVVFEPVIFHLFNTPFWFDDALRLLRDFLIKREEIKIAEDKKNRLEKELREVSIRVNLFEKILIPRCDANIKKIKIFLGDQQLAAVAQAKVAKTKIEMRKKQVMAIT